MYDLDKVVRLNLRDFVFYAKYLCSNERANNSILCNSFPKSGTHLLYQILMDIPGYSGWDDIVSVQSLSGFANKKTHIRNKIGSAPRRSIIRSHVAYDCEIKEFLQEREIKHLMIVRDLRDVCVSHANWVMNEPRIYLHKYYQSLENFDDRLMASIKGIVQGVPMGSNVVHADIGREFERWAGWVDDDSVLVLKFEDLVDRGSSNYILCVEAVYRHIGIELDREEIIRRHVIEEKDPNMSHTYTKGLKKGAGAWKDYFNEQHIIEFNKVAGDMMRKMGYGS
tara:strand:- start:433 stop:1275 length:843 start_codon:yes stop_codon:yes gene_type:complete